MLIYKITGANERYTKKIALIIEYRGIYKKNIKVIKVDETKLSKCINPNIFYLK